MNAGDFLRNIYSDMTALVDRARAFQAVAQGVADSSGLITIQRAESTVNDGEHYGRLKGFATADQDYVLCLETRGGGTVILGALQNTAPAGYSLDAALSGTSGAFSGALTVTGLLTQSGGFQSNGTITCNAINSYAASSFNVAALSCNAGLINSDLAGSASYRWDPNRQDTADTASTTNTASWVQAMSKNYTLPPTGTFSVWMIGALTMTRSPAGQANLRGNINGNAGGTSIVNPDTAIKTTHLTWHRVDGIAGGTSVPVKLEYKGNTGTGVTTSAIEPWFLPWWVRTG